MYIYSLSLDCSIMSNQKQNKTKTKIVKYFVLVLYWKNRIYLMKSGKMNLVLS